MVIAKKAKLFFSKRKQDRSLCSTDFVGQAGSLLATWNPKSACLSVSSISMGIFFYFIFFTRTPLDFLAGVGDLYFDHSWDRCHSEDSPVGIEPGPVMETPTNLTARTHFLLQYAFKI